MTLCQGTRPLHLPTKEMVSDTIMGPLCTVASTPHKSVVSVNHFPSPKSSSSGSSPVVKSLKQNGGVYLLQQKQMVPGVCAHALAHTQTEVIARKEKKRSEPDSAAPPGQESRWVWKAAERGIKARRGTGRMRGWRKLFSTSCWRQQSELPRQMQAPHGINEVPSPERITPGEKLQDDGFPSQPGRLRAKMQRPSWKRADTTARRKE